MCSLFSLSFCDTHVFFQLRPLIRILITVGLKEIVYNGARLALRLGLPARTFGKRHRPDRGVSRARRRHLLRIPG